MGKKAEIRNLLWWGSAVRLSHGMKSEINNRRKTWNEVEAVHRRKLTAVKTYIKEKMLYRLNCVPQIHRLKP